MRRKIGLEENEDAEIDDLRMKENEESPVKRKQLMTKEEECFGQRGGHLTSRLHPPHSLYFKRPHCHPDHRHTTIVSILINGKITCPAATPAKGRGAKKL